MNMLLKPEEKFVYALRDLYRSRGYAPFKMSKFETYELYMQNKDFLVSDNVITFTETDGTLMALKPDVTLSIVKNFKKESTPLQKVHYSENVYRRDGGGHTFREIMQAGLECLGEVGCYELCEVIVLAVRSLQTISDRFVLDISHMQIVKDVLDSLGLNFDQENKILQAIADKNEDALDRIDADTTMLHKLLHTCGPITEVLPSLSDLCRSEEARKAFNLLQAISQVLQKNGLAQFVHLDFSIMNDMNYYNGIVFRGYVDGIPTGVLSGGQYDKLMTKMHKNASGIGFAVYLDQLERLNETVKEFDVDIILLHKESDSISDLSKAADELSAKGESVLLLKEMPAEMRCRKLMRFADGMVELLEDNG